MQRGGSDGFVHSSGRCTVRFGLHRQWRKVKIFGNVKAKTKLLLCTAGEGAYGGVHVYFHLFLTSVLDGGEWSASGPGRFTFRSKPRYPANREARWAAESVWTFGRRNKFIFCATSWICSVASIWEGQFWRGCLLPFMLLPFFLFFFITAVERVYAFTQPHVKFQNSSDYPSIGHFPHSGYYMYRQFNIQQFYVLPTQCIYVFCVDLRTNSDYFPIQL